VMVEKCDKGSYEDSMDCTLFSLATNDDAARGISLRGTFEKFCGIVEEAFGSSKKVGWWLEYTVNHDPGHWWWHAHKPEWIDEWDPGNMYEG